MDESANLPEDGGSKTVDSISLSDLRALDFAEPGDEDRANQNSETAVETVESQGEGDELELETDDANTEGDNGEDDGQNSDDDGSDAGDDAKFDDTVVTLKGGEQVPVKELKLGYLRERDYRAKTQEVANTRRSLETMSTRVSDTAAALSRFLAAQLPTEPDRSLAVSDPGKFASQKAVYDSAMEQVNELLSLASAPKEVAQALTKEQHQEFLVAQKQALVEAFPDLLKTPEQHEKFFDDAFATARDLGFSDEEMQGNIDHRYFKLAHYARLGMQAEAARTKALDKVAAAPPMVSRGKPNSATAQSARRNKDAMSRLRTSGSIHDAIMVDFD